MFVHSQAIKATLLGVFELVEIVVIDLVPTRGVVETVGHIHPDGVMLFAKVIREVRSGHQMKEREFHCSLPIVTSCDLSFLRL